MHLSRQQITLTLLTLTFLFAGSTACGTNELSGDCAEFAGPGQGDEPQTVVERDDGWPYFPTVVVDGDKFVMYSNVIILGAQRVSVWRQESIDGVHFDEGFEVASLSGLSGRPFVVNDIERVDGRWVLVYTTMEDVEEGGAGPRNAVGMATSTDGLVWKDEGIVYEDEHLGAVESGTLFDQLIRRIRLRGAYSLRWGTHDAAESL
ncbi:MAG: hypothetical protein ACNA8W_19810 [Bradymonadaceae bacterium]